MPFEKFIRMGESILSDYTDDSSFARGKSYFKSGRVESCIWDLGSGLVQGQVKGSQRQPYSVRLVLNKYGDIVGDNCSCPLGGNCKHLVALGLTFLERQRGGVTVENSTLDGHPSPAPQVPQESWRDALKKIMVEHTYDRPKAGITLGLAVLTEMDQAVKARRNRLGVSFKKRSGFWISPFKLHSETGKNQGYLRWSTAINTFSDGGMGGAGGLKGEQVNYLKDLAWSARVAHSTSALFMIEHDAKNNWLEVEPESMMRAFAKIKEGLDTGLLARLEVNGLESKKILVHPHALDLEWQLTENTEETMNADLLLTPKPKCTDTNCAFLGSSTHWSAATLIGNPSVAILLKSGEDAELLMLLPLTAEARASWKNLNPTLIPAAEKVDFYVNYLPKLIEKKNIKNELKNPPHLFKGKSQLLMEVTQGKKDRVQVEVLGEYTHEKSGLKLRQEYGLNDSQVVGKNEEGRMVIMTTDMKENYDMRDKFRHMWQSITSFKLDEELFQKDCRLVFDLDKKEAALFLGVTKPKFDKLMEGKMNFAVDPLLAHCRLEEAAPVVAFKVTEQQDNADWFDLGIQVQVNDIQVPFHEIFAALTRNEDHLVLESGIVIPLNHEEFQKLKALLEAAKNIQDPETKGLRLSAYHAGIWEELNKMGLVSEQSERFKKLMARLKNGITIEETVVPKKLKAILRDYQTDGFAWLRFLKNYSLGGVLADDMGLGKTVQTLAFIVAHLEEQKADKQTARKKPFLIIAPTSVVENWGLEMERFTPHLKTVLLRRGPRKLDVKSLQKMDVCITSYALLNRDLESLKTIAWETVILDEAQWVKNHQSKTYAAVRLLKTDQKIALTGTPMENNLMELWAIFSIVAPGLFDDPKHFRDFFQKPIEKYQDKERLEQLRRRIKPFILRRKKELVAKELPLKTEQVLFLDLHDKHRKIYDEHLQHERKKVLNLIENGGLKDHRFEILRSLTKMRQMSLHPALVDKKFDDVEATKLTELADRLEEILTGGHKVLIFSQFTSFLSHVKELMERRKIPYLYLDGATIDRRVLMEKFQNSNEEKVFLISLKAGGAGLNLTAADYCILLDPWWNPAVETQAVDRAHRIGQKNHVFVYKMIAKNTVEEKVLKLQERKKAVFNSVLDEGDLFAEQISEKDILEIFS